MHIYKCPSDDSNIMVKYLRKYLNYIIGYWGRKYILTNKENSKNLGFIFWALLG